MLKRDINLEDIVGQDRLISTFKSATEAFLSMKIMEKTYYEFTREQR